MVFILLIFKNTAMIPNEDLKLIKKLGKVNRIIKAPYRKGINYIRLLDMRKEIADQLYCNSLNRVFK
jgi:hypothetical protein